MYRAIPDAVLCVLPRSGHAEVFAAPHAATIMDATLAFLARAPK
jgi:hypothetical protein